VPFYKFAVCEAKVMVGSNPAFNLVF